MVKTVFIDDDQGIVDALNLYAKSKRVPLIACQPQAAAATLEEHKPEVVFFDYLMSGVDGPGLLTQLRAETNLDFKAVLVTAHPLIEAAARDLFAGWIKKPFTFAELQNYAQNV